MDEQPGQVQRIRSAVANQDDRERLRAKINDQIEHRTQYVLCACEALMVIV